MKLLTSLAIALVSLTVVGLVKGAALGVLFHHVMKVIEHGV